MSRTSRVLGGAGGMLDHCFQIGDDQGAAMKAAAPTPAAPAVTVPVAATPMAAAAHKPTAAPVATGLTTKQLLAQLKARLRVVDREIVARKAFERERDQLRRLIAAAKAERDNVRRIRAAG